MQSAESNSTLKQKSTSNAGSAGKYLANLIYLATILSVAGFIWQSISSFGG